MKKIILGIVLFFIAFSIKAQSDLLSKGYQLAQNGELDSAIVIFTQCIQTLEQPMQAHYLRGYAYLLQKQYKLSLADADEGFSMLKTKKEKQQFGYAFNSLFGKIYEETKDYKKAITNYTKALKFDANKQSKITTLTSRADCYFNEQQYAKSIDDYNTILKKYDADNCISYCGLARSEYYLSPNKSIQNKAIANCNKALNLCKDYISPLKFRAMSYSVLGEKEKALKDAFTYDVNTLTINDLLNGLFVSMIEKQDSTIAIKVLDSISETSQMAAAHYLKGELLMMMGDTVLALNEFSSAVNTANSNLNYLLCVRAQCYKMCNQDENAFNDLNIAIRLDSTYAYTYYLKGNFYMDEDKDSAAVIQYEKCVKLAPKYIRGYISLSYAYQATKQYAKAYVMLDSMLENNDDNIDLLTARAQIYSNDNKKDSAIIDYKKVIEINDSLKKAGYYGLDSNYLAMIYNNIGYYLISKNNFKESETYLNKALKYDFKSGYILDSKGELEYNLKNYQSCINYMSQAIKNTKEDKNHNAGNSYYFRGLAKIALGDKTGIDDVRTAAKKGSQRAKNWLKENDK